MRVPSGEPELVRAAAAGDPAALAALWDAYGARVFAFCQRVLGRPDAAADAAQDAFLLAQPSSGAWQRTGESFGLAVFRAARTTSYELLARDRAASAARRGAGAGLSAAAARLRPQQRAALALSGLEGLRYAEIAFVLGVGADAVGALLARARLRLHDELHGTALAAAAVRSPDCEDVIPLLAAASDGELGARRRRVGRPPRRRCPTCPRTRRAMDEAAATYAAWSPAVAPSWLRAATLAELGARGAGGRRGRRPTGAVTTPRPSLSAALAGATLLAVAFAALLLSGAATLRQGDPFTGGTRLPGAARSLQVAAAPAPRGARAEAGKRTARSARRARAPRRPRRVAFVLRVRRVTTAPRPSADAPAAAARGPGALPRAQSARPSAGRRRLPRRHRRRRRPGAGQRGRPGRRAPGRRRRLHAAAVPASAAQAPGDDDAGEDDHDRAAAGVPAPGPRPGRRR